jgi:hypothetical protein
MGRWVFTAASSGNFCAYLARSRRVSQKMLAWHERENLFIQSLMELAVVDSKPTILGSIEDVGVTLSKANFVMIVGPSGMDGLRRNNVISGHHNHQ